jgi:uncharacterized oxidoreductase
VLLTGGGSGIGRALAAQLASKGNSVLICGRRLEALEETATASSDIHPYRCDLTSSDDIESMLDAIDRDGHRVDTLISNAAIMGFGSLAGGLDLQEAKRTIDANLFGPIELTQRMLGTLRAASDPTIIIVGSPAGLGPLADTPIYSSSKAGLHAYTLCLRHHLDGEIRVIEVFPPTVDTPMLSEKKWKKMSSEECARRMVRDIESGQEQVWIGESRMFRLLRLVLPPNRLFRVVNDWSPPEEE